jgi:DNA-binding PadR family transcriptional regulator
MTKCNDFDDERWGIPPLPNIPPLAAILAMAGGWGRRGWGGPFPGGGPFGPGGPGGRGGRGRGRRGQFGREELRLLLLQLIAEQPRHGYDLIKAMEDRSSGHYSPSPGVVYPALAMLADEGLIAEQASEDQRRKFAITEDGTKALEAAAIEAEQAMDRLTGLAERAERHRAPSVERAAMNLFTAVGQRLKGPGDDADLPHRIAEILDEAAQKIERL